jgi:Amidohydrolase family
LTTCFHAEKLFDGERLYWDAHVVVDASDITEIHTDGGATCVHSADEVEARFLMPGLVSAHEHVIGVGMGDSGIKTALTNVLALFLRYGVTSIRDAGSSINDIVFISRVQPRPRVVFSGPILDENEVATFTSLPIDNESCAQALDLIAALRPHNVRFTKIYVTVGPELYGVIVEAARARDLKISGHLWATPVEAALDMGLDVLDHVATILPRTDRTVSNPAVLAELWADFDRSWGMRIADAIREHGTLVTTTIGANAHSWGLRKDFNERLFDYVFFYYRFLRRASRLIGPMFSLLRTRMGTKTSDMMSNTLNRWSVDRATAERAWDNVLWLTQLLHAQGALVPGSDSPSLGVPPGDGFLRELELLQSDAGIPPMDVLRLATGRAAAAIGLAKVGMIREGWKADLVVLDEDPLLDLGNLRSVSKVMLDGALIDAEAITLSTLMSPP